ncbi:MAG: ammonium transporter, partial [Sphingobacteriales bacterium]
AIGLAAGICCYWGATTLKRMLDADDSLDVFGIHGIGGLVGAILTGVFALPELSGVEVSLGAQVIGAVATLAYSCIVSLIILVLIDKTMGLRVDEDQEQEGLDLSQHGEQVP